MRDASGYSDEVFYAEARDRARQAAAELVKGTGLRIQEQAYALMITNPRNPDAGQVYVDYADGYVSWVRPAWAYWGQLESLSDGTDTIVGPEKIIRALIADTGET